MSESRDRGKRVSMWQDTADDMIQAARVLIEFALQGDASHQPVEGWQAGAEAWLKRFTKWDQQHPEDACHLCGRAFRHWSAPSPLWNEVVRDGDINNTELYDGIMCPTCFTLLAEQAGIASGWRLTATDVRRELQTVTPSGRVWNEDTFLFEEQAGAASA